MNSDLDLVIFDCDGVLVDSERVANEVFARVLHEVCGLRFTLEEMFDTFVGHSRLQCLQKIEALIGEPPPAEPSLPRNPRAPDRRRSRTPRAGPDRHLARIRSC